MSDTPPIKWIIYEPSKTTVTRIIPELAVEIGLNESIVLLQISFWIGSSENLRDDKYWTFQSLREMQEKAFPYWSHETIRKAVKNLSTAGYILVGNYNQNKYDKTQWFALEPDKCSSLKSVLCAPVKEKSEEEAVKKLDRPSRNLTHKPKKLTTIPETPTYPNTPHAPIGDLDNVPETFDLTHLRDVVANKGFEFNKPKQLLSKSNEKTVKRFDPIIDIIVESFPDATDDRHAWVALEFYKYWGTKTSNGQKLAIPINADSFGRNWRTWLNERPEISAAMNSKTLPTAQQSAPIHPALAGVKLVTA